MRNLVDELTSSVGYGFMGTDVRDAWAGKFANAAFSEGGVYFQATSEDPEIRAIEIILLALNEISPAAGERAVRYLADRLEII